MNETTKTLTFVGVAALAIVLALEPWKRGPESAQTQLAGTPLFPRLTDALAPRSMDIIEFDETTASLRPFSVAQVNGLWSIPSHQNYPADAREHLAEATTTLMGVDILKVVTSNPGEHELYGVIDPDIQKLKPGMQGVGTRVTLKDGRGNPLANLIIGKENKDKPNQRFVRRAGQDQVLLVALKTDKLSTKFEDWIEKDLLKLNPLDIKQVDFNDYSIETQLTQQGLVGRQNNRSRIKLGYEDDKATWRLDELVTFDQKTQQPKTLKLTADQELNTEKLNTMKNALDDLQIVDVERKPTGLSGDLRASEQFVKNEETVISLGERGFHAMPVGDRIEIVSSEGEAVVGMKDGVEYLLRFGEVAAEEGGSKKDKKADKTKDKSGKPAAGSQSRYLFVMARFNPALIEKPKVEPVPPAAAPKKPQAAGDAGEPAAAKSASDGARTAPRPAAGGNAPGNTSPRAGSRPVPKAPRGAARGRVRPISDQKAKQPEAPAAGAAENDAAEDAPASDAPATEAEPASAPAAKPASAEDEKRTKVEQENKRKQDEYQEKIKKGQDHVKELNDRFADWYYHISDDVYQKIHLGRGDVVKKKEKPAGEGDKVSDLKALEKGLDDAAKPEPEPK